MMGYDDGKAIRRRLYAWLGCPDDVDLYGVCADDRMILWGDSVRFAIILRGRR